MVFKTLILSNCKIRILNLLFDFTKYFNTIGDKILMVWEYLTKTTKSFYYRILNTERSTNFTV